MIEVILGTKLSELEPLPDGGETLRVNVGDPNLALKAFSRFDGLHVLRADLKTAMAP